MNLGNRGYFRIGSFYTNRPNPLLARKLKLLTDDNPAARDEILKQAETMAVIRDMRNRKVWPYNRD
jgi:hypothetical protein